MAREAGPFTTPRTARRAAMSSRGTARGGAGPSTSQRRGQSSAVPSYRPPSSSAPVASTSRIPTIARAPTRPNAYVAPVPVPQIRTTIGDQAKVPATPPKSEPRRGRGSAAASTSRAQKGATPQGSPSRLTLQAMSDDDSDLEDAPQPQGLDLDAEDAAEEEEEERDEDEQESLQEAEGADGADRPPGPPARSAARSSLAVPRSTKAPPARNAKSLSGLTSQLFDAVRPPNRQAYSSRVTTALARTSTTRSNNSDSFATAAGGELSVSFAGEAIGGDDGGQGKGVAKLRQSLVAPDGTIHTPTLDERCEVLVTNSNAVLSFYTELVEEGVAEDSAQDMNRNWDPFESYKTNQLLAEGQYHNHFIDAREVVRNHNVSAASISATFFDTMSLVNRATFVHYVWQLPRAQDHATTIEAGTWAPRAALELLEARRVFLNWIVPNTLPISDDVLSLYLDLCTEAFIVHLRQDNLEGGYDEQELRDRATGFKANMFGVEAVHTALARSRKARGLSSDDIASIEMRFETFANVRMLECEELDDDWRFLSEEWPLVRVASDLTRFVSQLDRPGPMPACSSSLPFLMAALERSGAPKSESAAPSDSQREDDATSEISVPDTDDLAEAEGGMPSQSTPQTRRAINSGRESSARSRRVAGLDSVRDVEDEDEGAESDATSLDEAQKMDIMIKMAVEEAEAAEEEDAEKEDGNLEAEADETVRGSAAQRIRIDSQNRLVKFDGSGTPARGRKRLLEGTGQGVQLQEFDEGNDDVFMEQQIKARRALQGAKYRSKGKGKSRDDDGVDDGDGEDLAGDQQVESDTGRSGRASKKKASRKKASFAATEVFVEVPATPRMSKRSRAEVAAVAEAAETAEPTEAAAEEDDDRDRAQEHEGPDFDLAGDDEMPEIEMDQLESEDGEEEVGRGHTTAARRSRRTAGQGGDDEEGGREEAADGEDQEMSLPPPGQVQGLEPRQGAEGEDGEGFEVEEDEATLQIAREATKQRRRAARPGLRDIGNTVTLTPTRKYQGSQRRSKRREQALEAVAQRRRSTRLAGLKSAALLEEVDTELRDENVQDAEEAEVDQLALDPTRSGAAAVTPRYKRTSRTRQPKPNKNASIYISGGNMNGKRSWTLEETETLLDALYRVARRKRRDRTFMPYATVIKLHGPNGTKDQKLARWNNVQMKDKARNECLRMRREGRTIPYWRALLFPTLWEPKRDRTASQAPAGGAAEEEEEDQLGSDSDSSSDSDSEPSFSSSSGEAPAGAEDEAERGARSGSEAAEAGAEARPDADAEGEGEGREGSGEPSDASSLADREEVEAVANSSR